MSVFSMCDPCKLLLQSSFLVCILYLGLCAEEIHVCGEAAAINLVTELMYTTGEEVEVGIVHIYLYSYILRFLKLPFLKILTRACALKSVHQL